MRFLDYVNDDNMIVQLREMVDLPIFERMSVELQSPAQILKKDMDRLIYQMAEELQIWATQMQEAGHTQGAQAGLITKILANPTGAATTLIRQYVVTNIKG